MVAASDHPPHQGPAADLRDHHAARCHLRRRALRPARPLFVDDTYTVVAHFADSGGIFAGGEVTYRGVGSAGRRDGAHRRRRRRLPRHREGLRRRSRPTPLAVVGNRSAVGEQYVELQPQTDHEPYLARRAPRSRVEDTRIPIATDTLLTNITTTVGSVDRDALRTTVDELGAAFDGTGEDLQRIIDTGNSFIETANDNFDVTTALIRDGNTVLNGQIASESAIRTFARDLLAVQRHPGRLRPGPAPAHRQRLAGGDAAADLHRGQPGRARQPDQQPGHHRRGHRQAPQRHRAAAGDLPLRRGGRLHRRLEVPRHRALRRPLRPDHHRPAGLPPRLRGHRHRARRRTAATGR